MKALDVAFSRISPQWCNDRQAEGWRLLIQDVWTGGYANNAGLRAVAEANLRDWRQQGGLTAVYSNAAPGGWMYDFGRTTPRLWVEESERNAGAELQHCVGSVADFEIADGNLIIYYSDMVEFIDRLEGWGKPAGTYSGDWFVGLMKLRYGDASKVQFGKPYWYARYDNVPIVRPSEVAHPMGPVKAKQYGGSQIAGVTVDENVFDDDFFGAQGDDDMTPEQEAKLDRILKAIGYSGDGAPGTSYVDELPIWINRVLGLRTADDPGDGISNATLIATIEALLKEHGSLDYEKLARALLKVAGEP